MNWLRYFLVAVIAYLLGNFSTGVVVSKAFAHTDIRTQGSGNAGATNVLRTYGWLPSVLTLVGDALKAIIAALLGRAIAGDTGMQIAGVATVIGHNWPVFYHFKGGKGILCSGTLLLLLDWRIAAVGWGLFALLWLTTRYVSLGSVSGAASFPITTLIFCRSNWTVFVLSLLIAALVIWAHRENIGRLLHGTESRFRWHTDAP